MNLNEKENTKSNLVLVSSIWMGVIGLSLILFDGIILSLINPERSFQASLPSVVLGLFSITLGLLYWKEIRWAIFLSAGLVLGAALFANGLHSAIYILSPTITAAIMSFYFTEKSRLSK